jgi:hypothetical protein
MALRFIAENELNISERKVTSWLKFLKKLTGFQITSIYSLV